MHLSINRSLFALTLNLAVNTPRRERICLVSICETPSILDSICCLQLVNNALSDLASLANVLKLMLRLSSVKTVNDVVDRVFILVS